MRTWLFGTAVAALLFVGTQARAQVYSQQGMTPSYSGYSPSYYPPSPYGYGGPSTPNLYFDRSGYWSAPAPYNGYSSYGYSSNGNAYPAYGYAPQGFAPQYQHFNNGYYGGYHGSTSRYWDR